MIDEFWIVSLQLWYRIYAGAHRPCREWRRSIIGRNGDKVGRQLRRVYIGHVRKARATGSRCIHDASIILLGSAIYVSHLFQFSAAILI